MMMIMMVVVVVIMMVPMIPELFDLLDCFNNKSLLCTEIIIGALKILIHLIFIKC